MAAYAALVSLMNDLGLIPNHPTHSFSFDEKQITSISQIVHFLVDFMESYDSHGCSREAAQVLESRIASAAHAAHDVIESHVVDQIHAGSTRGGKVRSYFFLDLQRAVDNMEFVKRKAMQFKAKGGMKAEQPTDSSSSSAATSPKPVNSGNCMVGFEEVVVRLVEIITGEPSNQRLVVPIVGMGGLGKTSLAKTVYDHSYLDHHFDIRLWATISQQFSAQSILKQLLYRERIFTTGGSVGELGEQLHKMLYGRRYLIVLDDMWSEEAWDEIQIFFPNNGNGNRVVVTTRLSNLAAHLSSSPFEMKFLDEDKSWELFCGKAFGGEEDCPVELEEIGKKIVRRCGGLPLSIVVIAGHLRKSCREIQYWEKVANYMNPIVSIGEEEQCLEIMSLSYQHLPAYLKPCFLYLGIFKEDGVIDASQLINMWIGEGFIKPKKGLSLEEVAEDYLKDLIDRNLILVHFSSWNGKVEWCKIHDTVRELCLKVCKKEMFMFVVEDSKQFIRCTELLRAVIPEGEELNNFMTSAKQSARLLRSLVYRGGGSLLNELLVDCSLLRVFLHDSNTFWDTDDTCFLPLAHFQHVNLRFRAFRLRSAKLAYSIPASISACWSLQTLYIDGFHGPITLPYEIWEMPQLRHLQANAVCLPDPLPDVGLMKQERIVLQNLYTLIHVINLRLTEEVCIRIPNLEKLMVSYDHFCDDHYCFQNLGRFTKLRSLRIVLGDDPNWCGAVLSLTFPTSLEELCLTNCHLHWEDLTMMIKSLPHLGMLQLSSVHGSEWNLDAEEFCSLKILRIFECPDLVYLNANCSHFPSLENLYLFDLPKLNEVPFDIGEIPTLKLITLLRCSSSAAVSAMRMVVEQETSGNHDLQLHLHFMKDNHQEFARFQEMLEEECLTTNSLHLYYELEKIKTTKLFV